jgi:hypothetical protein
MKQSEPFPSMRLTPFEVELQEICAKHQGVSKTLSARRALIRGSYSVVGAMVISALRTKHDLSYAEMLEILGTAPEGELPKPCPREEGESALTVSTKG